MGNKRFFLRFNSEAKTDVRNAMAYYLARSQAAAKKFRIELYKSYGFLELNADLFAVDEKGYRSISIHGFPYRAYYRLDGTNVFIVGLLHERQNRSFG